MTLKQSLLDLQLSQAQSNAGLFLLGGYLNIEAVELSDYDKKFGLVRDASGQFAKKAGTALDEAAAGIEGRRSERSNEALRDKKVQDGRRDKDGDLVVTKNLQKEVGTLARSLKRSLAEASDRAIEEAHKYVLSDDFKNKSKKVMEAVDKIDKVAGEAFKKVQDAYVKHVSEENRAKISKEVADDFPATREFINKQRERLNQAATKASEMANTMSKATKDNLPAVIGSFCGMLLLGGSLPLAAAAGITSVMVSEELKEATRKSQRQKAMDKAKEIINEKVQDPTKRQQMIFALETAQRQAEWTRKLAK